MSRSHFTLAHAKLNLSLRVLAREASGFHQIESLFCAIELADEIEITLTGDDVSLEVLSPPEEAGPAPDLGAAQQNLAWRAADAFATHAGVDRGIAVKLTKRIPHGAGLGGGSSDAAAVLRALNSMHDEPLSRHALLRIGAGIGSDVPFFLSGAGLALAWGRGGRIAPLPALPSVPVVLAQPPERIPTGDAYAALSHLRGRDYTAPPALLDVHVRDWNDAARGCVNDFEQIVFQRVPVLQEIRDALEESGAVIARMTGTGSVVFGTFDTTAAAEQAAARIRDMDENIDVLTTATLSSMTTEESPPSVER